jgi:radical SAM superfamily enzyme YgiQ (UPF0313 family)
MSPETLPMSTDRSKVVLFNPHHFEGPYATEQRQPLALLSIAALPASAGFDVVIVDATVQPDYRRRVLEECRDALCFGTTSILGHQPWHAASMAKEVKEYYPDLPVVSGGWFPSVRPGLVLEQGNADIVVRGQGEVTFLEILNVLRDGGPLRDVAGIAYRRGEEIVSTPFRAVTDLNTLPPVPYGLINFHDYFESDPYDRIRSYIYATTGEVPSNQRIRVLYYCSSYGCPDACDFCSSPRVTGRRWTALDPDRIVDEIEHLMKRHPFNVLTFWDANWGVDQKRVYRFCRGLLRKGIKLHWSATMESHVLNRYDEAVVDAMAESGCIRLLLGAEAGHPETLKSLGKNLRPGDIGKTCAILSKRRITSRIYYIVGFPGESSESVQATVDASCDLADRWTDMVDVCISFFLPIPGTPMHARAVELGFEEIRSLDGWNRLHHFRYPSPSVRRSQGRAVQWCMRYYFYWACGRLRESRGLRMFEALLHRAARFRMRHRMLRAPVEFRLVGALRRIIS